jgi:hypothetical protein
MPEFSEGKTKIAFPLGDGVIHAMVHQYRSSAPVMINVHDDEDTSVAAGLKHIEKSGGRLIELTHASERLVTFHVAGRAYTFDPNRIFSDAGITATLKKHSSYSPDAHAAIRQFANEYLRRFALEQEPVIIALHNTVDGTFSIESFAPNGQYAAESAATHASPHRNKFDFYYVTDARFFDFLKRRDFNVVLQNNAAVTDDGSLSVHFSRRGIPYVNIEAEINHLAEQIEMVEVAREMIETVL